MKAVWISVLVLAVVLGVAWMATHELWGRSKLGDYPRLWRARDGLPATLQELEALAMREDGVGWQARVLLGRYYASQGAFAAAATHFRIALALRATSSLREELARALEAAGQGEEALAEWSKLLPKAEAIEAVLRLERDPVQAARMLVQGGAPAQALAVLAGVKGSPAALERARALVALGRRAEAVQEFQTYLAASPHDPMAQLELGKVWERMGEQEKALQAYQAAGALGAYNAGFLLESLGRTAEAIAAYMESPEPEARWRAARLLEERGQENQALGLYRELASSSHRVADDAALRAYLILTRRGEPHGAAPFEKNLPPAFLWLLGRGEALAPTGVAPNPLFVSSRSVEVAQALVEVLPPSEGPSWARAELDLALRKASPTEKLAIGEWYAAQGDFNAAFRLGVPLLTQLPCRRTYALAYPRAYEATVRQWAEAYGVDPCLVWAVMREESAFSPTAVSSSDARGLMQLLPSTARWIAEDMLHIPYREADLWNPESNIRLGTWYLAYLLRQFDGDVARAVAAYNGGPGNLRRWTAHGVPGPADLPALLRSPETREYLVKVLNAWLVYRWLYAGSPAG